MADSLKDQNFVVVAHKFHTTPEDDLVAYLNAQSTPNVLHICHSFSDAPDRRSFYRWYREGRLITERSGADFRRLPEPLIYVKELLSTVWWVVSSSTTWDRYVGLDGLCSMFGLVLRTGRRVRCVSFWNIDLVPTGRFAQRWKDRVYKWVNGFSALHADEMWDHTDLMVKEKERLLGLTPADYRAHRVVPLGVWVDRIPRFRYDECDQHTLVFMGHLLEKQGVQLVLQAIPKIVEHLADFHFKVIGSGAYEPDLRRLADSLGVERYVTFLGRIESDEEMEREVAQCGAGIAPYIRDIDTYTQFGADPGKIKTYLACGLPILLTDVPWIASEIEAQGCGSIVSEDLHDIATKVVHILVDGESNQSCRDRAGAYALDFDWWHIFDGLRL